MKTKKLITVLLLLGAVSLAFCQKSWIYLEDYNVLETEYGDAAGTAYVYDVSHEDEIIVKAYPFSFFHDPISMTPYHTDMFRYFQAGDVLYTVVSEDPVLHMYAVGERAELTELPGINVKDYSGSNYFGCVRVNGDAVYVYAGGNIYSFDISDVNDPKYIGMEKEEKRTYDFDYESGYGEYFTTLTPEQMALLTPHPIEGYVWVLPDGHLIAYKYHYYYADISPVYTTFEDWSMDTDTTAEEQAFCTGDIPDGFNVMRSLRLFGNTLVSFERGVMRRYEVQEGGNIISFATEECMMKAVEDRDADMLKKLAVQYEDYYHDTIVNSVFDTQDEAFIGAYLANPRLSWYASNPAYVAASRGSKEILQIIAELHPEWLTRTWDPEKAMSYTHGILDYASDDVIDYLLDLGVPNDLPFGWSLMAGNRCYIYGSPYDDTPMVKLPVGEWFQCNDRCWFKKDGTYKEWYRLTLSSDDDVWYIPVGGGNYSWPEP